METATETVKCYTKEETLRENTAVSCEDILPDYLQDIEKIAKVDAVLLPQQHSMESAALCCRGNVVFTVVYFSPDGEIFTRQITLPYEINCKAEHLTPQSIVRIGQKAEGVSCRVATPRKLMLRAQVRTELCRYEPPCTEAKLEGDADACGKIMQRKHSVTGCRMLAGEDRDAKLGADLVLPGNYPEIETLLDTTLTPLPPKTTMQQGGIEYSAPCRVLLFYKGSDGEYYSYSQTVQTEGLIPIAEASPKMSCFAQSTLCSKSVQSAPDNMGQMRVVEIDALLHIECTCFQNTPMQITVDAFSANCPLKADYAPLRCEELCLCTKSALTLSGSTKTESPVKKILCIDASADYKSSTVEDDQLICNGIVTLHGLYQNETGKPEAFGAEIPFKYKTACRTTEGEQTSEVLCFAAVSSVQGDASADGIDMRCELELALCAKKVAEVTSLCSLRADATESYPPRQNDTLLLYYAQNGEDIYEIAKQYHTDPELLRAANKLPQTAEKVAADDAAAHILLIP